MVDILGDAGTMNVQGEEVKKLDVFANNQFMGVLQHGISCAGIGSEELDDIVVFDDPNANFKIINGNIWEHEADLDVLFLTLNEKYSPFLNNLKKIEWFEKGVFPFDKLENLKMKEVKKIGVIPWYSENYIEELTKIMGFAEKNSIEITLFFVDKNDQILFENIIQNTF